MASYNEYFEIKVEGNKETINSICEAIRNYAPYADVSCSKKKVVIYDMCKIADEDDACDFAQMLARASRGASFRAEGKTECSVSGEIMHFEINFKDGKLTLRHTTWYYETSSDIIDGFEAYEEFAEYNDEYTEEVFEMLQKNEFIFEVDGEYCTEVPYIAEIELEY
jgi:hypothetical protein